MDSLPVKHRSGGLVLFFCLPIGGLIQGRIPDRDKINGIYSGLAGRGGVFAPVWDLRVTQTRKKVTQTSRKVTQDSKVKKIIGDSSELKGVELFKLSKLSYISESIYRRKKRGLLYILLYIYKEIFSEMGNFGNPYNFLDKKRRLGALEADLVSNFE